MSKTFARILAVALFVAVAASGWSAAQQPPGPPVDPNLQFEVVSIKPFDSNAGVTRIAMTPGRVDVNGITLRFLFRIALGVQDYQVIGAPDWIDTERFSISAKAPDGAPPNANPVLIGNLLKDRFKLATHKETREVPVYNLVLARNDGRFGPNLKETSAECQATIASRRSGGPGRGAPGGDAAGRGAAGRGNEFIGRADGSPLPGTPGEPGGPPVLDPKAPPPCGQIRIANGIAGGGGYLISQIAFLITSYTGRPVVDKTGLTGLYDFTLKWTPDPGMAISPFGAPPGGAPAPPVDPDAPVLFTALQEQLGLKLDRGQGPAEVVVVDRVEKPASD